MLSRSQHIARRRLRRGAVVLAVIAAAATVSVPASAAAAPARPSEATVLAQRTSASIGIGALLRRVLQHVGYSGSQVVKSAAQRYAWRTVRYWTRQELVNWYCGRWYAYFNYRFDYWAYAARYYANANWAWRFCAANGY